MARPLRWPCRLHTAATAAFASAALLGFPGAFLSSRGQLHVGRSPITRVAAMTGVPEPVGVAADLLGELRSLSRDVNIDDYWAGGEWDLEGIRSDLEIERSKLKQHDDRNSNSVKAQIEAKRRKIQQLKNRQHTASHDHEETPQPKNADDSITTDLSAFEHVLASEWLPGTVRAVSIRSNRVTVDVNVPGSSLVVRGYAQQKLGEALMIGQDAVMVGQVIHSRVVSLDRGGGFLVLSLDGDPVAMRADLEAQLQRWQQQLGEDSRVEIAEDLPKVQDDVASFLLGKDGNVDLSTNQPDMQDVASFVNLPASQRVLGVVRQTASFGAYIDVSVGSASACGLAHLTELGQHSMADLAPGQQVWARVLSADASNGRLILSLREEVH